MPKQKPRRLTVPGLFHFHLAGGGARKGTWTPRLVIILTTSSKWSRRAHRF
nr:MAG TPA: hypothetical protein [Caudoviricetes sp.]